MVHLSRDADDKLPFNRVLEIEVKLANHHDVDILRFDMECFGATPEKIKKLFEFLEKNGKVLFILHI